MPVQLCLTCRISTLYWANIPEHRFAKEQELDQSIHWPKRSNTEEALPRKEKAKNSLLYQEVHYEKMDHGIHFGIHHHAVLW